MQKEAEEDGRKIRIGAGKEIWRQKKNQADGTQTNNLSLRGGKERKKSQEAKKMGAVSEKNETRTGGKIKIRRGPAQELHGWAQNETNSR